MKCEVCDAEGASLDLEGTFCSFHLECAKQAIADITESLASIAMDVIRP